MIQKLKKFWNKIVDWSAKHTSLIVVFDVIGIILIVLFCVLGQFEMMNQTLSQVIIYSVLVCIIAVSIPPLFIDYKKR